MTVTDLQPVTILIDFLAMGVGSDQHLRLQGDREHLPHSLAHDLIEHRTARLLGSASAWTTLRMCVPSRPARQRRHMIRVAMGYRSSSGTCAPSGHHAEDHPQVLNIARDMTLSLPQRLPSGTRTHQKARIETSAKWEWFVTRDPTVTLCQWDRLSRSR